MRHAGVIAQAGLAGTREARALATLGASLTVLVFLSGWPVYAMDVLGGTKALNYYLMAGAFAALVILLSFTQRGFGAIAFAGEPIVWCMSIYLFLGLLWRQFSPGDPEFLAHVWRARVLVLLLFVSMLVLMNCAKWHWVTWSVAAVAGFDVALYGFDLANPGNLVPPGFPGSNPGRAAGFHINANEAGSALVAAAIVLLARAPARFRGLVLFVLFAGVAATFSRSAIILSILLVLFASRSGLLDRRQLGVLLTAVPLLALALVSLYGFMLTLPGVDIENINGRLLWFATGGSEVDDSASSRIQAAMAALEMFLDAPILGQGFAASLRDRTMEPHNMYLMVAAEQGVVGLAVYAVFLYLIFARGRAVLRGPGVDVHRTERGMALVAMAGFIAIQSLFSHNILDQPTFFVALSALMTGDDRPSDRQSG